jgi:hypothetical protein
VKLAALIAAYHEADDPGGGLRATLLIAGRTLLERQVRLAVAAGADPVVIAVERVTAPLGQAVDRLRAEGVEPILARSAAEAAAAIAPEARLLLFGDGLLASETVIARLVASDPNVLLTVPDARVDDRYERIDAHSRWAGLALIEGTLLRDTAAMLRDWDLQSTLLRRAVQAGAREISVRGESEDEVPMLAETGADLAEVEERILAGAHTPARDWVSRYLLGGIEQAATRALMPTSVTPNAVGLAATLLMAFSGLAFIQDWLLLGLLFFLLATPLEGVGDRLAALRLVGERGQSWWSAMLPVLAAGVLLALAHALSDTRGWGCFVLAGVIAAFSVALRIETEGRDVPGKIALADPKGMAWLLLPFGVAGLWIAGLVVLGAYAVGSFFWAQHHAHRPAAPSHD